jgi:GNAT superfamily N-acetyltransferase
VAQQEDLPALLAFEQKIISFERAYDACLAPDPISYYDLSALIDDANTQVLIAYNSLDIIGSGYAQIRQSKAYFTHQQHAYLGFMYVKPEYRGLGVNQKILEELKIWAQGKGITHFSLTVYPENHSAVQAYKKSGFEPNVLEMSLDIR